MIRQRVVLCAAIALIVVGCRGNRPASASDVVVQLYTMKEAVGMTGAPSPRELKALAPFITDPLSRGLQRADSVREADMKRAPDEKPSFVEGDLFSSLFEGPTTFVVKPAQDTTSPARILVTFTNDREKPVVRWTDTIEVRKEHGKWLVHDVHYGGTWPMSNKGALLSQLPP